jgi:hypothetical protein
VKEYYKVVTNGLKSFGGAGSIEIDKKSLCVQYKIGKFVHPNIKHTKLFIFDTLKNAESLLGKQYGNNYRIYKIHAKGVNKIGPFVYFLGGFKMNLIRILTCIKGHKKYSDLILINQIPPGTLFAKQVKLVKRIY